MTALFLAGVLALVVLLLAVRAFVGADPKLLALWMRRIGAALFALVALLFVLRGNVGMALLLGGLALAILGRNPFARMLPSGRFRPAGRGAAGQRSEVETDYLRMWLDHDTGEMSGTVLKGAFKGRKLEELTRPDLMALLRECRVEDARAAALLEAFLDRAFGQDWRAEAGRSAAPPPSAAITPEQARAILGVGKNASADEIRQAYHRLMKKLHPDQGGSDYLASQINAARDVLLGD
jgi:hypothetical protein